MVKIITKDRPQKGLQGINVIKFLAKIPEQGIHIDDLIGANIMCGERYLNHLRKSGLVKENPTGSGIYIKTDDFYNSNFEVYRPGLK